MHTGQYMTMSIDSVDTVSRDVGADIFDCMSLADVTTATSLPWNPQYPYVAHWSTNRLVFPRLDVYTVDGY